MSSSIPHSGTSVDLVEHAQTAPKLRGAMFGLLHMERARAGGVDLAQLFHTARALHSLDVCGLCDLERLGAALRTASWRLHTLIVRDPCTPHQAANDALVLAIADAPFAARLEALYLHDARVSAACVHRLQREAAFPNLRTLDITGAEPGFGASHRRGGYRHALTRDPAYPDTLDLSARIHQRVLGLRDHDRRAVTSDAITSNATGVDLGDLTVTSWLVDVGELVRTGESLVELEGAKVTLELPSPCTGVVLAHHAAVDDDTLLAVPTLLATVAAPLPSVSFGASAHHTPPTPALTADVPPPGSPPNPNAYALDMGDLIALAQTDTPSHQAWNALCTRLALLFRLDPLQTEQAVSAHILPALAAWPDTMRRYHAGVAGALGARDAQSPMHRLARALVLDAAPTLDPPSRAALTHIRALTLRLPDHVLAPDAPIFDVLDASSLRLHALEVFGLGAHMLSDSLGARLARAPSCASLRRLTLNARQPSAGISDAGIDALLSAPFAAHLTTLTLHNTCLT